MKSPIINRFLINRDFFIVMMGQILSQLGSQMFLIACIFLIRDDLGSGKHLGLFMGLSVLPTVIIGPISGVLADRYSRRSLSLAADAANAVLLLFAAWVLFIPGAHSGGVFWVLIGVAMLRGVIDTVLHSAFSAWIPNLVPENCIERAIAFNQGAIQAMSILGVLMGSFLYDRVGAQGLFVFDAATFALAALATLWVKRVEQVASAPAGDLRWRHSILEGLAYVWSLPAVRGLVILTGVLNFFVAPIDSFLAYYVQGFGSGSSTDYAWFSVVFSSGAMLGNVIGGHRLLKRRPREEVLKRVLWLIPVCIAAIGLSPNYALGLVCYGFFGLLIGMSTLLILGLIQTTVAGEYGEECIP